MWWTLGVAILLVLVPGNPAEAQAHVDRGPTTIYVTPPKPIDTIEFEEEVGIERWRVQLSGKPGYIRFTGSGCTFMGEIYKGLITPLWDNMTFKTVNGKECRVTAIERQ